MVSIFDMFWFCFTWTKFKAFLLQAFSRNELKLTPTLSVICSPHIIHICSVLDPFPFVSFGEPPVKLGRRKVSCQYLKSSFWANSEHEEYLGARECLGSSVAHQICMTLSLTLRSQTSVAFGSSEVAHRNILALCLWWFQLWFITMTIIPCLHQEQELSSHTRMGERQDFAMRS